MRPGTDDGINLDPPQAEDRKDPTRPRKPDQLGLPPEPQRTRPPSSHQIPHPQGLVPPHAQGHFSRRMDVDAVDLARMPFEGSEGDPVSGTEDRYGAVFRGGEEVRGGGERQGSDGA